MADKKKPIGDFLKQAGSTYAGVKLANKELANKIEGSLREHSKRIEQSQQKAENRKVKQETEKELEEIEFIVKNIKLRITENQIDTLGDIPLPNNKYGWALQVNLKCFLNIIKNNVNMDLINETIKTVNDIPEKNLNWVNLHKTWCDDNSKGEKEHINVMVELSGGFLKKSPKACDDYIHYLAYDVAENQELFIQLLKKYDNTVISTAIDRFVVHSLPKKIIEAFYDRYYNLFKNRFQKINLKGYKECLLEYVKGCSGWQSDDDKIKPVNMLLQGWCEFCKIKAPDSLIEDTCEIFPSIKEIITIIGEVLDAHPEKLQGYSDRANQRQSLFWRMFFMAQENFPKLSKGALDRAISIEKKAETEAKEKEKKEGKKEKNKKLGCLLAIIIFIILGVFIYKSCESDTKYEAWTYYLPDIEIGHSILKTMECSEIKGTSITKSTRTDKYTRIDKFHFIQTSFPENIDFIINDDGSVGCANAYTRAQGYRGEIVWPSFIKKGDRVSEIPGGGGGVGHIMEIEVPLKSALGTMACVIVKMGGPLIWYCAKYGIVAYKLSDGEECTLVKVEDATKN